MRLARLLARRGAPNLPRFSASTQQRRSLCTTQALITATPRLSDRFSTMAMATAAAAGVTAAAMVGKAGKAECEVCADVETAEQMHNTPSTSRQAVLDFLETAVAKSPEDGQLQWRLGRACVKRAEETDLDGAAKLAVLERGMAAMERARAAPGSDACFKTAMYSGIVLNAHTECLGTKAQLEGSTTCKEHWVKAAELSTAANGRPDPTVLNLLGRWCFTFADMGWVTRRVAAAVFAVVPTSSYDEALDYFQRAETSEPGFYLNNRMMIGKCLLRKGDRTAAKEWLTKAVAMDKVDAEAAKDHAEATELLKQC